MVSACDAEGVMALEFQVAYYGMAQTLYTLLLKVRMKLCEKGRQRARERASAQDPNRKQNPLSAKPLTNT